MSAGCSSSIFAVDPASSRAVTQAWSPGDRPTAMQFAGGNLYVLDAENSQLRLFDSALRLNTKAIDFQAPDPMGIVIRDNEVISALAGKTITGAVINADSNGDGKISAREMHVFMAARENQPEHPQIWDSYEVGGAFLVR